MTPELLAVLLGLLGASGASGWWWQRRGARAHIIRTRTAWVRAGTIIRFGPTGATCLSHSPRGVYSAGMFGALGITGRALVFDGWRSNRLDRDIPLDGIRQINLCSVRVGRKPGIVERSTRALALTYAHEDGRWHVSTFVLEDPVALAAALEHQEAVRQHSVAVRDCGDSRRDFGPVAATRVLPDASGDWLPDRQGDLYLVPDMLVFNWTDVIPMHQIAHLDVFGGARALLRVEHVSGEVTGFEVEDPGAWADAIRAVSDIPMARHYA